MNKHFLNKRSSERKKKELPQSVCFFNYSEKYLAPISAREDVKYVRMENGMRSAISAIEEIERKYDEIFKNLDTIRRRRANELIMQFQTRLSESGEPIRPIYSIDTFSEDRIYVSFAHHKDICVTLNFTENDYLDTDRTIKNVEVAYLSYRKGSSNHIVNNTVENIVRQLLNLI